MSLYLLNRLHIPSQPRLNTSHIYYYPKMSISVFIRLGVSAGVPLEFNTIATIQKLFKKHSVFIYGIRDKPVDYDEQNDCFDKGILDVLMRTKSEDEFKAKLVEISELRKDENITCLRRKKEYVAHDEYAVYKNGFIMDDDTEPDVKYKTFNLGEIWFEFFDHCSSLDAEFDSDTKSSYNTVGSAHNFMARIKESIENFKELGVSEELIDITHYNVMSM